MQVARIHAIFLKRLAHVGLPGSAGLTYGLPCATGGPPAGWRGPPWGTSQPATVMVVALGSAITFIMTLCAWIGINMPEARSPVALVAMGTLPALALLAWYFSSMTGLMRSFGPLAAPRSIPRRSAAPAATAPSWRRFPGYAQYGEGPTMEDTSDWKDDLGRWLKPFLDRLDHRARRQMCPLYVAGLIGPGDRRSVQPMAERLAPGDYNQLHNFVFAGVWDAAPLETELLIQARLFQGGHPFAPPYLVMDLKRLAEDSPTLDGRSRSITPRFLRPNVVARQQLRNLPQALRELLDSP
jgi:DDE superfamily endonuclease